MTSSHIDWVRSAASILICLAAAGCMEEDLLTSEERDVLATMVLDDRTEIPGSPTNRFANDAKAAELGQAVFFDMRFITGPGTCRTCHDLTLGGADTATLGPTTVFGGFALQRNTPTVFNMAFIPNLNHWSGNFTAIWSIPSDVGTSALAQAHFMFDDPYYRETYEAVFGPMPDLSDFERFPAAGNYRTPEWQGMSVEDQRAMGIFTTNIGKALEAYQRRLIDRNAPFDRFMNGDETALSPAAIRGAKLFIGKAACNECHNGPAFSDFKFHNVGVPQTANLAADLGFIAAGAFVGTYPFNADSEFSDDPEFGAAMISKITPITAEELPTACSGPDPLPGCGAFKTARLRSIALSGPYMHTGGFDSLWDVVEFYNEAEGTDGFVGHRDPAIQPLYLTDDEISDLVAFLESLTGEPIPDALARCPSTIPTDACAAP